MHEKISEQSLRARQMRLRNLAMQLAIQMHPHCHDQTDAHEVADLLHEAINWQYVYVNKVAAELLKAVG